MTAEGHQQHGHLAVTPWVVQEMTASAVLLHGGADSSGYVCGNGPAQQVNELAYFFWYTHAVVIAGVRLGITRV